MIAEEHTENVTIVACGNALGEAIPPMILIMGIRKNPNGLCIWRLVPSLK